MSYGGKAKMLFRVRAIPWRSCLWSKRTGPFV
jgi:hypothetical protein